MRRSFLLFSIFVSAIVVAGCDRSGIHGLGVLRDPVDAASTPTLTWLRSTDAGTEILLIGIRDASASPTDPTDQEGLAFARGFVAHDSSTTLDVGKYTLDATGSGAFTYEYHYQFLFQPEKSLFDRLGSRRTDLSPPTSESLAIARDGDTLLVSLNGEQHRYADLVSVIRPIDATTAEGTTALFRVFNLPLFVSQSRLLAFGGPSMTQYVPTPGEFLGLVSGRFTVTVESYANPNTDIEYLPVEGSTSSFEDLTGIVISGKQTTIIEKLLEAKGRMRGTLDWTMYGHSRDEVLFRGQIDYSKIAIDDGLAAGGTYGFTVDGHDRAELPYTLASNVDLRDVLPITTP